jgi:hypothetical protein
VRDGTRHTGRSERYRNGIDNCATDRCMA